MRRILFVLILLTLSACSAGSLNFKFQASDQLNLDKENKSLPVLVKVYELKDEASFENATFRQLWKHDQATLGESLLSYKEVMVFPDQKKRLSISRDKQAKYIGVAAIFRDPESTQWRVLRKVPNRAVAALSSLTISLEKNKLLIG